MMPGKLQTANCSFPGIIHISDKISRSCKQLPKAKYSLRTVHWVTHSNINANKFNLTKSKTTDLKNKIRSTPWVGVYRFLVIAF